MASGTKIRRLARQLDECDAPVWVIGSDGRLSYLSAACADWLGIVAEQLIDRKCLAGSAITDDPLDVLAASISAPPGLATRGTASLRVQPPATEDRHPEPMDVRYVRVGNGPDAFTLAIAGSFDDRSVDLDLQDSVAIRQRIDIWRKQQGTLAINALAGNSVAARRMRRRIHVAVSVRTDIGFFGPIGSGTEWIARRVHQLSAPGESLVVVDGPLMDAELLDVTMMPVVSQLSESEKARATALIRGLDEMPMESQQWLVRLLESFPERLRLLGLCGPKPSLLKERSGQSELDELLNLHEPSHGILAPLAETLSSMSIVSYSLSERVEDIPLIATAMLDRRRAVGEGTAERINRAALDALVIYPWPRNLEELDEVIRHALRAAPGPSIGVEHLPLAVRSYRPGETQRLARRIVPLDVALQRLQLRLINEAIEATGGNRAEAARRLGISRARLIRMLADTERNTEQPSDES
jgi:transcriptional regulator with PAS, ATPase and Fis domain